MCLTRCLRLLTGAGLERKSPHNQSTRHSQPMAPSFIIIRQGGTQNSRTRMTQRNSCTTWVGSERLNSEPNSTLLRGSMMRSLPELWKSPGPGHRAYSTGATQGEGGLTQSLHHRDESSAKRNTVTLNEAAVTSHNVYGPVGLSGDLAA